MIKSNEIVFPYYKANLFFSEPHIKIGSSKYPVRILRELLSDEYYDTVKKLLKNETEYISVIVDYNDEKYEFERIVPGSFIKALEFLILNDNVTDKEFDRIYFLRSLASFDKFIENYSDRCVYVVIDNLRFKIRYKDIIKFLELTDDDYRITLNYHMKSFCGIPKNIFMYAVYQIIMDNKFLDKYSFPKYIVDRLQSIGESKDIDIEAINTIVDVDDSKLDMVVVNQNLIDAVVDGMPSDLEPLECAIYLYIKLCKILTYDPLFFALDQRGEVALLHEDIGRIPRITPKNNKIVCYEFNAIYGYFLQMFGITYVSSDTCKENYGSGHAKLQFRAGKYIVNADAVRTILDGDLVRCKVGAELNGLKIVNRNQSTREEFYSALERIYKLFKENNILNESLIKSYREKLGLSELTIKERLDVMIAKANDKKLASIDNLGYILRLKSLFYNGIELGNNVSFVVLRSNEDDKVGVKAVFTIMDLDDRTTYYIYEPNGELKHVTRDQLINMFEQGDLEYLSRHIDEIPNLDYSRGVALKARVLRKNKKSK